jgi:hypothetical protein
MLLDLLPCSRAAETLPRSLKELRYCTSRVVGLLASDTAFLGPPTTQEDPREKPCLMMVSGLGANVDEANLN